MFQICLLSLAICMDTLIASAGCSAGGIHIPKRCALLISIVGTVFLGFSLICAQLLSQIIPERIFKYIGFAILFLSGSIQIMKGMLTALFNKHRPHWNWKALGLVIDICFDETLADTDHSKNLNLKEAAAYAAALSLDSLATGLGAGMERPLILPCLILTLIAGYFLTIAGCKIGSQCPKNLSWIGGILLLILAFCRL